METQAASQASSLASWSQNGLASDLMGVASFQVSEFAEDSETRVNFFASERFEPLRAKPLHGERSHDATVEQCPLEHFPAHRSLRCHVAHKPASKGIARAGGIDDFLDGKRRRAKRMIPNPKRASAEENGRAVFAMFDHQSLRTHGQHLLRRPRQVALPREHFSFGVID